MKRFIFPLILFLVAHGFGIVCYLLSASFLMKEYSSFIMKVILGITFFIFIMKYLNNKKELFRLRKITKVQIGLTFCLFLLFAINNYFLSNYAIHVEFMESSVIEMAVLGFVMNSFYEEFAYRGFIQGYVNQNARKIKSTLSSGNLFASLLMLISHLGFFMVMDLLFAITGLILVLVFSIVMGYIRDKGGSIWFLIIVHTLVNFIHLYINIEHYQ